MRDKGFDQLPVLSASVSGRLVGLVTLGNLLSWMSRGRASAKTPVSEVMFDFSKIHEVVHDINDMASVGPPPRNRSTSDAPLSTTGTGRLAGSATAPAKTRKFVEITMDTPLSALNRFFAWNSAAVVTEKGPEGGYQPIAVVTKVDLLTWLVKQKAS
jgi:cystathionine beta-synthase